MKLVDYEIKKITCRLLKKNPFESTTAAVIHSNKFSE
jgi:hypothetical protein